MSEKIKFEKHQLAAKFLDPRQEFRPTLNEYQVRVDPLTGRTGHFSHFGVIKPLKLDLEKYNDPEIKGFCPFCGENKTTITPKFCTDVTPEGRFAQGEALLVPNLHPYDIYSSVLIMTDDHVVPLGKLNHKILGDAFSVGLKFLQRIKAIDPSLPYPIMTWNYMPPSGGGLVHPHQQYFTSANPGNQYIDEMKASKEFYDRHRTNFWSELIITEQEQGERYLGQVGNSHWMLPFVTSGTIGEIMCVFPNVFSIDDFTESDISDLVNGLQTVFRYFWDTGICSFNASLFWGPPEQKYFPAHFRIVPRTFMNTRDFAPDLNFFQLMLRESISGVFPEDLCQEIKPYFDSL
ncbi:MAG: hypothetical protein RO469_00065 [Thermincola sp.]|jgi:galactose-1-phosphate uridylyltransferase|nr:hypothetical protein [Thermincola sp.]MDT3701835.1 hypothetical protein [Thermincola sp.]